MFLARVCLYLMQARVDWVLIIFGTQVINVSVSYDYHKIDEKRP